MEIYVVLIRPSTIEYVGTDRDYAFTIGAKLKNDGEPMQIQKWINGTVISYCE